MADVSTNGRYVTLHTRVWYDAQNDVVKLTSNDDDLLPGGLSMTAKRESRADQALRHALEVNGVQARPFEPTIPGQVAPINLVTSNPKQMRTALLPERRYGFTQLAWSPGISPNGLVKDGWTIKGSLLITGDGDSERASLLHSLITQLVHKNGAEEARVVVLDRGEGLSVYAPIDSVDYTPSFGIEDVLLRLKQAEELVAQRVDALRSHDRVLPSLDAARDAAMTDALRFGRSIASYPLYMPHVFVVIHGWEAVMGSGLSVSSGEAVRLVDSVLQHGKDVGVHLVLSMQTTDRIKPPSAARTAMSRIVLRSDNPRDGVEVEVGAAEVKHLQPGEGYYRPGSEYAPVKFAAHTLNM